MLSGFVMSISCRTSGFPSFPVRMTLGFCMLTVGEVSSADPVVGGAGPVVDFVVFGERRGANGQNCAILEVMVLMPASRFMGDSSSLDVMVSLRRQEYMDTYVDASVGGLRC